MKFHEKLILKSKLRECFRKSNLCLTYTMGSTKYIYPKIHSIDYKEQENKTEIVWTLINGIDPREVKKKEYVFKQFFSKEITIDGDLKKFVLNIYHNPLPKKYKYKFNEFKPYIKDMKLPFILGRNITGQIEVIDIADSSCVHPLLAGATGSGKSSLLRSALLTIIHAKTSAQVNLYLADLKRQEFQIFKNVEMVKFMDHRESEILRMLQSIKKEMNRRMELSETFNVNHVDKFPPEHKVPVIFVVIDEVSLVRNNEDIQDILADITAIGRSLNVILLVSLQKPSHDNLDTRIRANTTVKLAFKVDSKINSNVIGVNGAENIEESGVMIAKIGNKQKIIKAPFIEAEDAIKLLDPYCIVKDPIKDITPKHTPKEVNPDLKYIDLFDTKG